MARPNGTGLIYYNIDTDRYLDIRIKKLKKEFGCNGIAVYDYLLCNIYRSSCCGLEWDDSTVFDVADYFYLKENLVKEIVNYCCNVGLFNKELRTNENILTSKSIQERYITICKKSKIKFYINPKHLLFFENTEDLPKSTEDLPKSTEDLPKSTEDFEQSKVNEIKLQESKNNTKIDLVDFSEFLQNSSENEIVNFEKFKILFFKNSEDYDFEKNLKIMREKFKNAKTEYEKKEFENAGIFLKTESEKRKVPQKEKRKVFVKPTFNELLDYFSKKNNEKKLKWTQEKITEKAEDFLNHYESNGWKVGKNPMKNWKSAVNVNWIKDKFNENGNKGSNTNSEQKVGRNTIDVVQRNLENGKRIARVVFGTKSST